MRAQMLIVFALMGACGLGYYVGRSSVPPVVAAAPSASSSSSSSSSSSAPKLLPVPIVRQSTEYTCGAAAVTSILAYWKAGTDLREQDLQKLMHTTEAEGTDPVNIVKTLGDISADGGVPPKLTDDGVLPNDGTKTESVAGPGGAGGSGLIRVTFEPKHPALFDAKLEYRGPDISDAGVLVNDEDTARDLSELRRALERKDTVLLELQAWREDAGTKWSTDWDDGHWVVLVGIDDRNVYTMDPYSYEGYTFVPIPELVDRWHGEGTRKARWQHIAVFVHARAAAPPTAPSAPLLRME